MLQRRRTCRRQGERSRWAFFSILLRSQGRTTRMKNKNYISGAFLFALSIVLFFQSKGLTVWEDVGPSEGFFPLALSVLLGLLSLLIMLQGYLRRSQDAQGLKILGPNKKKFVLYLATFFAFGLVFQKVGYSLTLTAFFVFILRIVEHRSWKLTIVVTVVSIVVSHGIFILLLAVPLPEGVLAHLFELIK